MKTFRLALALILLLALVMPAAAQDAPSATSDTLAFSSQSGRVAFRYPASWAVRDGRTVTIATSLAMLEWQLVPTAQVTPGDASIQIEAVRLGESQSGALGLIAALEQDLSRYYAVSAPETLEANGRVAALISASAQGFEINIVIVDSAPGEVFAVLMATAPGESLRFESALVTVIESLAYAPLAETTAEALPEPTMTATPEVTPEPEPSPTPGRPVMFESAALGLRFTHPSSWIVSERGDTIYISADPANPVWDFGAPLTSGQSALNIQVLSLADMSLPAFTTPRDFMEAALDGVPSDINVSDITDRNFGGTTGVLVELRSAEFDGLALLIPGRPGELVGIQGATAPGQLATFTVQVLALADSLEIIVPPPPPQADARTDYFAFSFPGDWSLGDASARRIEVGPDMLTALRPPADRIALGAGRVTVEWVETDLDGAAYLETLAAADDIEPLTLVERAGWQVSVFAEDGAQTLFAALPDGDCLLLVRVDNVDGPPQALEGVALVLESLVCTKDSADEGASE